MSRYGWMKKAACAAALSVMLFAGMAGAQTVAEGNWLNLFDGESLFGWTQFGDVNWSVANGALVADKGTGGWLASTCQFTDFELSVKIKVSGKSTAGIVFRTGLEGHYTDNGGAAILLNAEDGKDFQQVDVKVIGAQVTATVDGKAVEGLAVKRLRGYVGIQYHKTQNAGCGPNIEVAEFKLRPLNLTPLFNGKDLTGWDIIPDHASVFSVVDGALNIKNGNGQIETAGLYEDFMLQLDIFSNGEHLNSGVFFRTPKGVFWKGYESQVRNQWQDDDRTKPVDFGTGGIYGVQESRKVVSSDKEWFHKTIVCEGNHMAVWLNGYLVSDLYDTRPVNDKADGKTGFVNEPGTINLQGHDPTTDLSFKNINIQTYPEQ